MFWRQRAQSGQGGRKQLPEIRREPRDHVSSGLIRLKASDRNYTSQTGVLNVTAFATVVRSTS